MALRLSKSTTEEVLGVKRLGVPGEVLHHHFDQPGNRAGRSGKVIEFFEKYKGRYGASMAERCAGSDPVYILTALISSSATSASLPEVHPTDNLKLESVFHHIPPIPAWITVL